MQHVYARKVAASRLGADTAGACRRDSTFSLDTIRQIWNRAKRVHVGANKLVAQKYWTLAGTALRGASELPNVITKRICSSPEPVLPHTLSCDKHGRASHEILAPNAFCCCITRCWADIRGCALILLRQAQPCQRLRSAGRGRRPQQAL